MTEDERRAKAEGWEVALQLATGLTLGSAWMAAVIVATGWPVFLVSLFTGLEAVLLGLALCNSVFHNPISLLSWVISSGGLKGATSFVHRYSSPNEMAARTKGLRWSTGFFSFGLVLLYVMAQPRPFISTGSTMSSNPASSPHNSAAAAPALDDESLVKATCAMSNGNERQGLFALLQAKPGDGETVVRRLDSWIIENPNAAALYVSRAYMQFSYLNQDDAVQDSETAISLKPDSPVVAFAYAVRGTRRFRDSKLQIGLTKPTAGAYSEVITDLQKALDLATGEYDTGLVHYAFSQLSLWQREPLKAQQHSSIASRLCPSDTGLREWDQALPTLIYRQAVSDIIDVWSAAVRTADGPVAFASACRSAARNILALRSAAADPDAIVQGVEMSRLMGRLADSAEKLTDWTFWADFVVQTTRGAVNGEDPLGPLARNSDEYRKVFVEDTRKVATHWDEGRVIASSKYKVDFPW